MIFELFPPEINNRQQELFCGEIEYRLKPEMGDAFRIAVQPCGMTCWNWPNTVRFAGEATERKGSAEPFI